MPRTYADAYEDTELSKRLPRVPWSTIGPDFIRAWGYPDNKFQPEHVEILGPSGSGKTFFEATILQERVAARDSAVVFIATKPADKTITQLGWPIVDTWAGVQKNKQCIFWPKTRLLGSLRKKHMASRIDDLLAHIWGMKAANIIVVFDEIATVEGLSKELKDMIQMYWREARSVGITIVAMKQRPQGIQRDMHSEASWVIAFKPKDEDDGSRVAEVLGSKKMWMPALQELDRERHEFILLHVVTGQAVISWVDVPLQPADTNKHGVYRKVT